VAAGGLDTPPASGDGIETVGNAVAPTVSPPPLLFKPPRGLGPFSEATRQSVQPGIGAGE
jgi:hypothetical protein